MTLVPSEMVPISLIEPFTLKSVVCVMDTSGFAFGFGVDRMVMLKYGIDDIRALYESDMRFLNQF